MCGSGFPLSLSEWSFTIFPTLYNRKIKLNVLSVSLNKTFPSFLYFKGENVFFQNNTEREREREMNV